MNKIMNEIQQIIREGLDNSLNQAEILETKNDMISIEYFVSSETMNEMTLKDFLISIKKRCIPENAIFFSRMDNYHGDGMQAITTLVYDKKTPLSDEELKENIIKYFNDICTKNVFNKFKTKGYNFIDDVRSDYGFNLFNNENIYDLYINNDYNKLEELVKRYLIC